MDIELVTDVARLQHHLHGWEALADLVSAPRSAGGIVAAWAQHMMSPELELRIWVATEDDQVLGVLPFVAEPMARDRVRLVAPATDMMFGAVPIAQPDRANEVARAVLEDFAGHAQSVNLATLYWLPGGSPWTAAFRDHLSGPDWVATGMARYSSFYTSVAAGIDVWLAQRNGEFRRTVGRRARRSAEQGFRLYTTIEPAEIMERLPRLQPLYVRRKEERGGEGYRFEDDMVEAIGAALELSAPGRFRLSVIERDDLLIGGSLAVRAGSRMSAWLTGYDPEWSKLGPGIAALLEALDAAARAGCEIVDLGVGDQPYKDDFQDEDAAFPLESVTWCRPRLARLLQLEPEPEDAAGTEIGA
ncbi:MAG: GNAT family N-acetyltransferase [Acidimicrobiales bacterium]